MDRRTLFAILALALLSFAGFTAHAQDKFGVLMLHGKNPGGPSDPYFGSLRSKLDGEGMLVAMPDMPWSARRYVDGHWDKAMAEMAEQVKELRGKGATKIVLAGHSMGCPAALSYAARHGDVDAVVLLAPGHVPYFYFTSPNLAVVRKSIEEARAMVAAGEGDKRRDFNDINQGKPLAVRMTAKDFLSYWDPESDAEMSRMAPRLPAKIPALWVIGSEDPLIRAGRGYVFDKLPANPKSRYLEVKANHLTTPQVAAAEVTDWIKQAVAQ